MKARCIKCNKLWNISIKAIIPKNGYKCPKCRFKENANESIKRNA